MAHGTMVPSIAAPREQSPMPVEHIANFLPIDDRIGTAGQPSETELREAASDGYTAVVNLGLLDPR